MVNLHYNAIKLNYMHTIFKLYSTLLITHKTPGT